MNKTPMIQLQKERGEEEDSIQRLGWMAECNVPFGMGDIVKSTVARIADIDRRIEEATKSS
jgi:hypothetical protein